MCNRQESKIIIPHWIEETLFLYWITGKCFVRNAMTWHHKHELPQYVSSWMPLSVIKLSEAKYYHKEAITKEAENHRQPPDFASHGLMHFRIWFLFGNSIIPENQMDTFTNKNHLQAVSSFIRNEANYLFVSTQ